MKTIARAVALAASAATILPVAVAATASADTTTTVYANSTNGGTQWMYNTQNGSINSYVHGGDTISAISVGGGWYKIASGSNAGKYILNPSTTPTEKPIATNVTRYAQTNDVSSFYPNPISAATSSSIAPTTALVGDLYSNGWFQTANNAHPGWWQKNTMASNPYNAIETQEWRDTSGFKATAPHNVTVTRYALANNGSTIRIHSSPSYLSSTVTGTLPTNTALVGNYENSHWFHITSGTYAGKYVSAAMIWTSNDQTQINGKLTSADLCQIPDAMRTEKDSHDQFMGCESLSQLEALSSAEQAKYGFGVAQWDSYRDYATQVAYLKQYGSPQAAQPGTSNHGLGNAFDMRYTMAASGALSFTSPQVVDFRAIGADYGWTKPAYLDKGASNPEPWHFEMFG